MAKKIVLRQMGGSVGVTIPKEIAERFHLNKGDEVFVSETDKGILITPYDPSFDKAMAVYGKGAKKYRNALRELSE
ncbi:MAG: AbrB/MazE/SpoVT family DNA-binding domain-containing protein [Bacillota bacterium]|nr:AbrB/MazE/SpoVT family DNA-binding domain-containing protein [Bacillota bacterium]